MPSRRIVAALFRLSRREYYADFFVTPPLTVVMAAASLSDGISAAWCLAFVLGAFLWTFYEYAAHRWIAHRIWVFRDAHKLHHARQRDYIALHPAATLASYAAIWAVFGVHSSAAMVGFSGGYIAYSVAHTLFHYASIREGSPLFAAARRHALHHRFAATNFGVTTPLWDAVFGTLRKG